jgi:predicted dehydrogenase
VTKLKMAVIGAGHLGRIHARLLSQMSDVELVGIVDPVPAARESAAAECRAPAFGDHDQLVDRIDAAVVATPTRHHHAVALDLLRQNKPLLVEKPLCDNLAHADELVETARLRGVVLQVGHIERFNPAFLAAQARVGQPRYVEAVRASGYTGRSVDIGVVFDLMIHDIDLLLALVAAPITRVAAMGVAVLGRNEDVAQARVEFADGAVANLSASRLSFNPAPKRQMQIWSEQGFVAIDFGNRSAALVSPNDSIVRREMDFEALDMAARTKVKDRLFTDVLKVESLEIAETNALADELRDFVDAVRLHREPRVTGQQGRDALALADAILESIAEHSWHGAAAGPIGPLAHPSKHALRGPHWHAAAQSRPAA